MLDDLKDFAGFTAFAYFGFVVFNYFVVERKFYPPEVYDFLFKDITFLGVSGASRYFWAGALIVGGFLTLAVFSMLVLPALGKFSDAVGDTNGSFESSGKSYLERHEIETFEED